MRKVLQDQQVRGALICGVTIATLATIGARRFPVPFAALGVVWAILVAVTVTHAARRVD